MSVFEAVQKKQDKVSDKASQNYALHIAKNQDMSDKLSSNNNYHHQPPVINQSSNINQNIISNNAVQPSSFHSGVHFNFANIQTKLKVSQHDDIYEQEANRIAEQVMMQMSPSESLAAVTTTDKDEKVNRKCKSCEDEEEEEKRMVHRKTDNTTDGYQIPKDILRSIGNMGEGTGLPLDVSTRTFMESRFGFDFSKVRIHNDEKAAKSSQTIKALAFTTGNNIAFRKGQYIPTTEKGKRLIAHELTHVIQQSNGKKRIQRSPDPAPLSDIDSQKVILDAVDFFFKSAKYFENEQVAIDRPLFDRVMNSWYSIVVNRERIINERQDPGVISTGDMLKLELQNAYRVAIRVLMTRAAKVFHMDERDLYHENIGRIPMWAWKVPHHMESGISTPIAEGRFANPIGEVSFFTASGFHVTILPDVFNVNRLREGWAETSVDFTVDYSSTRPATNIQRDLTPGPTAGQITFFIPHGTPGVLIQSYFWGSMTQAAGISGYGRGTTPEDIAGGRVTPESKSVGSHEGIHGLDFVEFLENNPPPQFTGEKGDTSNDFEAKIKRWQNEWKLYKAKMLDFTQRRTHCVGKTIDQFRQAEAKPGVRILFQCPPRVHSLPTPTFR